MLLAPSLAKGAPLITTSTLNNSPRVLQKLPLLAKKNGPTRGTNPTARDSNPNRVPRLDLAPSAYRRRYSPVGAAACAVSAQRLENALERPFCRRREEKPSKPSVAAMLAALVPQLVRRGRQGDLLRQVHPQLPRGVPARRRHSRRPPHPRGSARCASSSCSPSGRRPKSASM